MLWRTLLTLACTCINRLQFEKRVGLSLQPVLMTDWLGLTTVWGWFACTASHVIISVSWFFTVFISGMTFGLSTSCIFGHSFLAFINHSGPLHHSRDSASSTGLVALEHRSAGFSSVETWFSVNLYFSNAIFGKGPEISSSPTNPSWRENCNLLEFWIRTR